MYVVTGEAGSWTEGSTTAWLTGDTVECLCRIITSLARAESRHINRILLYTGKRGIDVLLRAGPGRTGMFRKCKGKMSMS